MSTHYEHSGSAPLFAIAGSAISGLLAATIGAFVYSYAAVYIPFIYVNFLLTAGLGGLIGGIVSWRAKAGHIRSRLIPALIGCGCACVGLYVAWGADFLARLGWNVVPSPEMAFDPAVLKKYVEVFYKDGFWSLGKGGGNVTGVFLAIVWAAEALVIIGLAAGIPWTSLSEVAYCEECGCWCETKSDLRRLDPADADVLAERVNQGEVKALAAVPRTADLKDFLRVDLMSCPSCGENHYLKITRVTTTLDKKGNEKVKHQLLVDKLTVARSEVETVANAGRDPAA